MIAYCLLCLLFLKYVKQTVLSMYTYIFTWYHLGFKRSLNNSIVSYTPVTSMNKKNIYILKWKTLLNAGNKKAENIPH